MHGLKPPPRHGRPSPVRRIHLVAGLLAPLCIAVFFVSTVWAETLGSPADVARLKTLIVSPGLWVLLPALMVAGGSGLLLGRTRGGRLLAAKKQRMRFIAANGLLVLLPCALLLQRWAAAGSLDTTFYAVQALELLAGAANFMLLALNVRDGLRMSGRLRKQPASPADARPRGLQ